MDTRGIGSAEHIGAASTIWPEEYETLFILLALLTIVFAVAVVATAIIRHRARRIYRAPEHTTRVDEGADA